MGISVFSGYVTSVNNNTIELGKRVLRIKCSPRLGIIKNGFNGKVVPVQEIRRAAEYKTQAIKIDKQQTLLILNTVRSAKRSKFNHLFYK